MTQEKTSQQNGRITYDVDRGNASGIIKSSVCNYIHAKNKIKHEADMGRKQKMKISYIFRDTISKNSIRMT